MMTEEQTFSDQCEQGRRPRISWERLYPQIMNDCEIIYRGNFEDIFRITQFLRFFRACYTNKSSCVLSYTRFDEIEY